MFGHERNALDSYRGPLMEIQGGDCFYCHKALNRQADVDHFIPWCRYPTDLGHNFVLSHPQCNNSKSDYLGAEEHLANWVERIRTQGSRLNALLEKAELPCDLPEPSDEAITQPGDLWILGDHRLLCGDSSNSEDVDRLLAGAAIRMILASIARFKMPVRFNLDSRISWNDQYARNYEWSFIAFRSTFRPSGLRPSTAGRVFLTTGM